MEYILLGPRYFKQKSRYLKKKKKKERKTEQQQQQKTSKNKQNHLYLFFHSLIVASVKAKQRTKEEYFHRLNVHVLKLSLQWDGIWRWGL